MDVCIQGTRPMNTKKGDQEVILSLDIIPNYNMALTTSYVHKWKTEIFVLLSTEWMIIYLGKKWIFQINPLIISSLMTFS